MMDDFWNFQDGDLGDESGEGGGGRSSWAGASRDCMILMIDAQKAMFDETLDSSSLMDTAGEKHNEPMTCFAVSLKAVHNLLCQKCCSGEQEYMAVVLINTEATENENNFSNIFVWQKLEMPNAERVKQIEEFLDADDIHKKFVEEFGGHKRCRYDEAFWLSAMQSTQSQIQFGNKRVFLFTNDGNPHSGDQRYQQRIEQRVADLYEQNIEINLIPLGNGFDEQFWKTALNLECLSSNVQIEDLLDDVRRKEVKRRSMGNIELKLADGLEISLGLFNLIAPARIPTAVYLDSKKHEEVKPTTTYFSKETGEKLLDCDMRKYQTYGGQRIEMDFDEVESLRRICKPGMVLLGFKPISSLKLHHHVRPAMFIYPNEQAIRGSTKLYRALVARCLVHQKMAVCRLTARANMAPRLVALLPQAQIKTESGLIEQSQGFHVVFLPFADDMRNLDKVMVREEGDEWPKANKNQVETARNLINKLRIKYHPDNFHNPVLDCHYRGLEAMALEKEKFDPPADQTKPDFDAMTKRAGKELEEFKRVFDLSDQPTAAAKKRGAAAKDTNVDSKKPKADVDLETEARDGKLMKLTVAQLKEQAASKGIVLSKTKKADIIDEINRHFGL